MKVVINRCFGGFSVSPEAALWMWEHGWKELATPIDKYFSGKDDGSAFGKSGQLAAWRERLSEKKRSIFLTVFTPDESAVISTRPDDRAHPLLIQCVEEMGDAASGDLAELSIVEIPDGIDWQIDEYDGMERVEEVHRSWA